MGKMGGKRPQGSVSSHPTGMPMTNMPARQFRWRLPPAAVVIMPRPGMIFVEVFVPLPEGSMIRAVLGSAVETVLMGALVGFIHFPVEAVMFPMIACVLVIVVVRLVSRGRHRSCGQRQRCGRNYGLRHGHDRSPWLGLLGAAHREGYGFRSEYVRKASFIDGLCERRNLIAILSCRNAARLAYCGVWVAAQLPTSAATSLVG